MGRSGVPIALLGGVRSAPGCGSFANWRVRACTWEFTPMAVGWSLGGRRRSGRDRFGWWLADAGLAHAGHGAFGAALAAFPANELLRVAGIPGSLENPPRRVLQPAVRRGGRGIAKG